MTNGSNTEFINKLLANCFGYLFIIDPQSQKCYWSRSILQTIGKLDQGDSIEAFSRRVFQEKDCRRFVDDCRGMCEGERPYLVRMYRCLTRSQWAAGEKVCIRMWMLEPGDGTAQSLLVGMISEETSNCFFDLITGIPNNSSFRKYLAWKVRQGGSWCVLMLGIDDFSNINELYSYHMGDMILGAFASRIQKLLPDRASVFRLDGDKFGILFAGWNDEKGKEWYYKFKETCIAKKFNADGHSLFLSVSGGLCCFPRDGVDFETIYHNASKALQKSKKNGKNNLVVYSEELAGKDKRTAALLEALRESVIMGFQGLYMVYQPIVSAENLRLVGGEALLRWKSPEYMDHEEVSPSEFIPVLEENGLILETGNWVLETAIRQCSQWIKHEPDFQMHINMSSRQFEVPAFKHHLMDLLSRYHVKPSNIMLELTESGKVKEPALLAKEFDFIRSQGIRISLDDFGTGYSSLEVLRLLSADEMKIDRSFLERISYDTTDQALLSTLINLSHKMNMVVCVEGIENEQMQEQVCRMKPDLLQGYFYSVPLRAEDFADKYFGPSSQKSPKQKDIFSREYRQSLVYAEFRPAQSINSQELIDNAYAGIFQVGMDEKFTFLSCNEGYRRMLGYTPQEMEELFRNRALGFVHEDDMEYVNNEIRRQLGEGDTVTIEFRVVRKDGTPVWIMGTGNVYRSSDGSVSLIVVIINNDKAKRRQLEKEQEAIFRKKMLNNLPTGIKCVRFDADFTIEYISQSLLDLIGYTKEDIAQIFDNKYMNMIYEEDRSLVINDILEQLKVSNVVTMKYRSPCKDGHLVCLETVSRLCPADADGIQRAFSVVVDITDTAKGAFQKKERGLNIANRYENVAEQWGEYFMEYDLETDKVVFSDNFNRIFGYPGKISSETLVKAIHKEDIAALSRAIGEARDGIRPSPFELRLLIPGESYHWFSVSMTPPDRLGDKPVTVLAKIMDIDKEKREKEQLLMKSQQDCTTGLLNKAFTEERIRNVLDEAAPGSHYALFMLDIDHFKKINDIYGHIAGDVVLRLLAESMCGEFGKEDIIGRIGGDEFLIFTSYGGDVRDIIRKAEEVRRAVCRPVFVKDLSVSLTVSMGIACYPEDGSEFYTLYRSADSALYRCKAMEQNGFCLATQCYLDGIRTEPMI
ncbi:MAG: diguanylate cyclase [Clostridium sp.]|nr:diguanylate cyclase [Clostridium sp.]